MKKNDLQNLKYKLSHTGHIFKSDYLAKAHSF